MSTSPKIEMRAFEPRLGNYEDCAADVVRQASEELTGATIPIADIIGWAPINSDRTAFLVRGEPDTLWIVTMDHDCDGSKAVRVEVVRQ